MNVSVKDNIGWNTPHTPPLHRLGCLLRNHTERGPGTGISGKAQFRPDSC